MRNSRHLEDKVSGLSGAPPEMTELHGECAFLPRCPKAVLACRTQRWPALAQVEGQPAQHVAACYNPMFQAEAAAGR